MSDAKRMTADEARQLRSRLSAWWKWSGPELGEFVMALEDADFEQVQSALEEHRKSDKYRPAVSSILARVKNKAGQIPFKTHAEIIRETWVRAGSASAGSASDAEIILRWHRWQWWQRRGMCNPFQLQFSINACACALVAHGVSVERSEQLAPWIDAEPGSFRMALQDMRVEGGSYVDPLALESVGL